MLAGDQPDHPNLIGWVEHEERIEAPDRRAAEAQAEELLEVDDAFVLIPARSWIRAAVTEHVERTRRVVREEG